MKVSRILLGSLLVLVLAACRTGGGPNPIDPTDPTTTTDPTDPTTTTDPTDPTVTTDPTDPTVTTDPTDPTTTTDPTDPTVTTDPSAPVDNAISGTLIVPQGVELTALVAACPVSNFDTSTGDCTPDFTFGDIESTGAYTISGLDAVPHVVLAAGDADGDNNPDYGGAYPDAVTPPMTGIDITLAPLGSAASTPTATFSGAALRGAWDKAGTLVR